MSVWMVLAAIFAVYVVLVLCFWRREGTGGARFDERQERARGTAYQYGFCTLAVSIWLFSQLYQAVPWIGCLLYTSPSPRDRG